MSNSVKILKNMVSFDKSEQFDGFSKVIIIVSDEIEYSAGTDTGRTLTLNCPWGTQEIANNILQSINGFQYQPMTAENALIDPSVEIGDGISANGVYSGVYSLETKFTSNLPTTISAPADEEIDHEFQYKSKQEREVKRKNKQFSSQLAIHADQIEAEVEQRKNDVEVINGELTVQSDAISAEVAQRTSDVESINGKLDIQAGQISAEVAQRTSDVESINGKLDIQAGQISAKVSKTGGDASSFGWELKDDEWKIVAGTSTVLKATKDGLEVSGKITATSGTIGGFTINNNDISYNNQTWGGTNTTGIYIGLSGIQLGSRFQVDNMGNLYAYSGTFEGYVNAGNIRYGDNYGTFDGGGISGGSISGSRLKEYTIDTSRVSSGISLSLGKAGSAYSVTHGGTQASTLSGATVYAGTLRVSSKLYLGGTQLFLKSTTINGTSLRYVAW